MQKRGRRVGAYSSPDALARLDNRSREGRIMAQVRADLTTHLGGKPSATQRAMIDRAAWLTLHMALIDAKIGTTGSLTDHDSRTYLAWSNTLTRTMRSLGLHGAAPAIETLDDIRRRHATAAE